MNGCRMLTRLTVIILQYIQTLKHDAVHLKLIGCMALTPEGKRTKR